jgi:hypothetical protein
MIALALIDTTTKFIHREMLDQLRKDDSAFVHLPLPFWFDGGREWQKGTTSFQIDFEKSGI